VQAVAVQLDTMAREAKALQHALAAREQVIHSSDVAVLLTGAAKAT
jgi:hypothetical protein